MKIFIFLLLALVLATGILSSQERTDHIVCSHCGRENPPSNTFCSYCGTRLPLAEAIEESLEVSADSLETLEDSLKTDEESLEAPEDSLKTSEEPTQESVVGKIDEELYQQGVILMNNGDYLLAIAVLSQLLNDFPASSHARQAEALRKSCRELALLQEEINRRRAEMAMKEMRKSTDDELLGCLGRGCGTLLIIVLVFSLILH